jgi:hypothetical protein
MTNDVTKRTSQEVDGFEGYEDSVEGGEERTSNRIIQGSLVKFSNEATWETGDGEELSPDLELEHVPAQLNRWISQGPVDERVYRH